MRNNPLKFPERFSWIINQEELDIFSRSKFSTLKNNKIKRGQNIKYLPRVFTEQGVAMLATILKSKVAVDTSIQIMDAFVTMRHYIGNNEYRISNIETKVIKHDSELKLLQESLNKLEENRQINEIYFNGKIYDAYSKIIDIFNEAKKELIIVDRYVDKTILDMIKDLKCRVILITNKNTKLKDLDIEKYNKTYNNLKVFYDDTFHDRYFVIDKNKIYHSDNSINHIGYRKSSIDTINDISVKNQILNDINKIVLNISENK